MKQSRTVKKTTPKGRKVKEPLRASLGYFLHWLEGHDPPIIEGVYDWVGERSERARVAHNFLHVYRFFVRLFRFRRLDLASIVEHLDRWLQWELKDALAPHLKWGFAATFSYCMNQPEPPAPIWNGAPMTRGGLFGGKFNRFYRSLIGGIRCKVISAEARGVTVPRSCLYKAQALLNLKRGCAVVSDNCLRQAVEKTVQALSKAVPSFPDEPILSDQVCRSIDSVVREVFSKHGAYKAREGGDREGLLFSKRYRAVKYTNGCSDVPCPSQRGHVNRPGTQGGAMSDILSAWCVLNSRYDDELASPTTQVVSEPYSPVFAVGKFGAQEAQARRPSVQSDFLTHVRNRLDEEAASFEAKPIAVPEPLKVRVVTSGPEYSYWVLKDLQKFLWKHMSRHPTFILTGKPADSVTCNLPDPREGFSFSSVDYRDATNEIKGFYSEYTARAISRHCSISEDLESLFVRALVGHKLVTKKGLVDQTTGQLMGSPVSFPILCIINAAIVRLSLDMQDHEGPLATPLWSDSADLDDFFHTREFRSKTSIPLTQLPVRINGDDAVFLCNDRSHVIWKHLGNLVGLTESIGKSYRAPRWFQINSLAFRFSDAKVWEPVPFVNGGYLCPFAPKGGQVRTISDLSPLAREFLKAFEGKRLEARRAALAWFRSDFAYLFKQLPDGISYWLPCHLGGLGLPIIGNLDPSEISFRQRELAEYLRQNRDLTVNVLPKSSSEPAFRRSCWNRVKEYMVTVPDTRSEVFSEPECMPSSVFWDYSCYRELSRCGDTGLIRGDLFQGDPRVEIKRMPTTEVRSREGHFQLRHSKGCLGSYTPDDTRHLSLQDRKKMRGTCRSLYCGELLRIGKLSEFYALWKKSKGQGCVPDSKIGVYLNDPPRRFVLKDGSSDWLDDLINRPDRLLPTLFPQPEEKRIPESAPKVVPRAYGVRFRVGS